jgi:hypothetical protein
MITHLPVGGSVVVDGERFSISAKQSSKTFPVTATVGESLSFEWYDNSPTLMLFFALVSTHAALFVFANSSPSSDRTCLLIGLWGESELGDCNN